jgi:hypothetical protein
MAYDISAESAFHKDETHPEGWDYQTAEDQIRRLQETAVARFYFDDNGNANYESRFARNE